MRYINHKSDFQVIINIKDKEGNIVAPPSVPWEAVFADENGIEFKCYFDGTNYTHCIVDFSDIVCFVDNPGFACGKLRCTFHQHVPSEDYCDGVMDLTQPLQCDIMLSKRESDDSTPITIEAYPNWVRGPQGEQGIQGPQGIKGDKGDKGDKGEKGDKGDTGAKGDKGEKGDTGAKGEKGERGEKGDQGERGLQGVQGVKGDDGVSPTVSTSKTGKVTTIEITDAKGTHTATVNDGESVEVVQSTGQSTTSVMSQKSVSDNISKITDVLFPKEASNTLSVDSGYNIGQTYIVKKTNLHVNAGVEYNITIQGTVVSNTTVLRLMDENNSQIIVVEIDGSSGNENRTITFTPPQSGYIAMVVLELKEYGSYTIKTTPVKDDSITSTVERLTKKVDEVSSDHTKLSEIDNTLYGSIDTFTEEYDFTKSHIQDTYVVKIGNIEVSKGHKYEITISPSEDGVESFLRIYDASNTSILQSEIPNSSGESNRTITFECEFDGKIAVVIKILTKLCTINLTVKDITNVGGIVKKLEQLEDSNSIIKQLKVLVIGDSITTGSSSAKLSSVNMPSYGKYNKWVDILIELGLFNSDTINCSQHATGFVAKNGTPEWINNSDFLSRLKYFVNNNTINPSTIDLIIVFGGINDFKLPCEIGEFGEKDTTKFIPALEAFYNYLEETFTQARIVVCTPTRCAVTTGQTEWSTRVDWAPNEGFIADENSLRITYDTYVEAIKNCCKKYSLPVIDLAYESGFMPLNKKNREKWSFVWNESASIPTDGIHPNYDFQQKMLAPMIYGFVSKLFMSQNNFLQEIYN